MLIEWVKEFDASCIEIVEAGYLYKYIFWLERTICSWPILYETWLCVFQKKDSSYKVISCTNKIILLSVSGSFERDSQKTGSADCNEIFSLQSAKN